jgi:hypothetical protein
MYDKVHYFIFSPLDLGFESGFKKLLNPDPQPCVQ